MIEIRRDGGTWAVINGGQVVESGLTMLQANRLYSRLMTESLIASGTARKRKIFA